MIVIAHRGASGHAPEHTFAAWDLALEMGADYIEQDLQMSADSVLIVLHDETLDRTTGGLVRGRVSEMVAADLVKCDVGSWFNTAHPGRARPEYAQQRIATLEQVLERYHERARFYIETKNPRSAPGMEDELIRLLRRFGLTGDDSDIPRVIIQSFSAASLKRVHRLEPGLPLVRLFGRHHIGFTLRFSLAAVARYGYGIGPSIADIDRRLVEAAHVHGLVVHPYTVNGSDQLERMASLGVDGVFTDYPDRAPRA